jgi:hypothetical protein
MAAANTWMIQQREAGDGRSVQFSLEIRLFDVADRFNEQQLRSRFRRLSHLGKEAAGVRQFVHNREGECKVDAPLQVCDPEGIG